MKKRIAIITPGGVGAGAFSQGYPPLVNFIEKLSKTYDITVYSIHLVDKNFTPSHFAIKSISGFVTFQKLRSVLLFFLCLIDHLKKPFDLIHSFWVYPAGTLGVVLGKLIKRPTIVTIQGGEAAALPEIKYGNMLKPYLKKITLWTCEQATCLNSISKFLILEMEKHGLKRKDSIVIPFGAEKNLFSYKPKAPGDVIRIIHVANLTEVKDQRTLLKAFAAVAKQTPAELRIIGGDFLNGKLQLLSKELGLQHNVKFMGSLPTHELTQHYAWADIMLHTSLHEGQSGVVMEAMASGIVVCGTRVGIIHDLGDDYFEIVDIGDYTALSNKVLSLRNDTERYNELKSKSLAYAAGFDASWTVKQFAALYETLI